MQSKPYVVIHSVTHSLVKLTKTGRKMMIGKWWRALGTAKKCGDGRYNGVRTMVGKASDRAGVHGSRTPDAKSLDNVITFVSN